MEQTYKTTRGKHSSLKLAYLAGIIDGEGSICITKFLDKRKKSVRWQYIGCVAIGNTDKRLIEWVIKSFSPNKTLTGYKYRNTGKSYHWELRDNKAMELLKAVYPFLKLKKEQAKIMIDFQKKKISDNRRGIKLKEKDYVWREKYRLEVSKLNHQNSYANK